MTLFLTPEHVQRLVDAEAGCVSDSRLRISLARLERTTNWILKKTLGCARYTCSIQQLVALREHLSKRIPPLVDLQTAGSVSPLEAVVVIDHLLLEGLPTKLSPSQFKAVGVGPPDLVARIARFNIALRGMSARKRESIGSRALSKLDIS